MPINKDSKAKLNSLAKSILEEYRKGFYDEQPDSEPDNLRGRTFLNIGVVLYTQEFVEKLDKFERAASRLLGSRGANRKTIRDTVMSVCQSYVRNMKANNIGSSEVKDSDVGNLVEKVLSESSREYTSVRENYIIEFCAEFDDVIEVGRVKLMRTSKVFSETKIGNYNCVVFNDKPIFGLFIDGADLPFISTSLVWVVKVQATKENAPIEAEWLIEVALSFMRLSSKNWKGCLPNTGEIEPLPTLRAEHGNLSAIYDEESCTIGGARTLHGYQIDQAVADDLSRGSIQESARQVFNPKKNSVAQRVANGLGWMTRGRQAHDNSQRVLSFATALEALLSSTDKGAPVVQTICRHASVILTNDVSKRLEVFQEIKRLYGIRSAIVHNGDRGVLARDAESIQYYSELIYKSVIRQCNLAIAQDKFSEKLRSASHGLPWKP